MILNNISIKAKIIKPRFFFHKLRLSYLINAKVNKFHQLKLINLKDFIIHKLNLLREFSIMQIKLLIHSYLYFMIKYKKQFISVKLLNKKSFSHTNHFKIRKYYRCLNKNTIKYLAKLQYTYIQLKKVISLLKFKISLYVKVFIKMITMLRHKIILFRFINYIVGINIVVFHDY
jgi:hypothetical protein